MDQKITIALQRVLDSGEQPVLTFQTGWKPNFGTPTLWLALTNQRIILFSTLRGGKVYIGGKFSVIDSVNWDQQGHVLKILFRDAEIADCTFPLPASISDETIAAFLSKTREQLS